MKPIKGSRNWAENTSMKSMSSVPTAKEARTTSSVRIMIKHKGHSLQMYPAAAPRDVPRVRNRVGSSEIYGKSSKKQSSAATAAPVLKLNLQEETRGPRRTCQSLEYMLKE